MERDETAAWICTALMRLGTSMTAEFDRRFQAEGLTQAQFRTLLAVHALDGGEGVTPSALADHLLLERPSVTGIVARLVERGWLVRRPGENRRSHRLGLSAAGGALLGGAGPAATRLAVHTLAGLSEAELRGLRRGLELVEARLRAYTPPEET